MIDRPSVLCPVDFSDASRGALRYAVALAEHVHGVLTVATVDAPLLESGSDVAFGKGWLKQESRRRLRELLSDALFGRPPAVARLDMDVATGHAAPEILRIARTRKADIVVMSSRGLGGLRKRFLGSTAERVLRETPIPVLVTPPGAIGPDTIEAARQAVRCVFAPVDLSDATPHQVRVASGLAEAFGASLVLAHVSEPLFGRAGHARLVARFRGERRRQVAQTLRDLTGSLPAAVRATVVTAEGDVAAEISRLAGSCRADVIVMGLHAAVGGGPRMGSVTYRVLCETHALVLAVPPQHHRPGATVSAVARSENLVGAR